MNILFNSIQNIIPLLIMVFGGYVLEMSGFFLKDLSDQLVKLIKNVTLPALIFSFFNAKISLNDLKVAHNYVLLILLASLLNYVIAFCLANLFNVKKKHHAIFINAVASGNTLFIGIPINNVFFEPSNLNYIYIYCLVQLALTLTLGMSLIKYDDLNDNKKNIQSLVSIPLFAFILVLVCLVFNFEPVHILFIKQSIDYLGNLTLPLSMLYVGIVLFKTKNKLIFQSKDLLLVLISKFVLGPVIISILMLVVIKQHHYISPILKNTFLLQSMLPVFSVLPIFVNQNLEDVKFANDIVVYSMIGFIILIPLIITVTLFL